MTSDNEPPQSADERFDARLRELAAAMVAAPSDDTGIDGEAVSERAERVVVPIDVASRSTAERRRRPSAVLAVAAVAVGLLAIVAIGRFLGSSGDAPARTDLATQQQASDERVAAVEPAEWEPVISPEFVYFTRGDLTSLASRLQGPVRVPVYDEPGGPARTLVYRSPVDNTDQLFPLISQVTQAGGSTPLRVPLVLRVLDSSVEGWFKVQAPIAPHNRSVWVSADDFELKSWNKHIEVDLAGSGRLSVYDRGELLWDAPISQGRSSWPTPTHATILEGAIVSAGLWPPEGRPALLTASYSETFGANPTEPIARMWFHEVDDAHVLGHRVTNGEVRLLPEDLDRLMDTVFPGTPILIFDSSDDDRNRDAIVNSKYLPAETVSAIAEAPGRAVGVPATEWIWKHCDAQWACRHTNGSANDQRLGQMTATARPGAGDDDGVIAVFDAPGGPERVAVDVNPITGETKKYPLTAVTPQGEPRTLRVVGRDLLHPLTDDVHEPVQWLLVDVPVRPHRRLVWVRADNFTLHRIRLEIDIDLGRGSAGMLTARDLSSDDDADGDGVLLEVPIVSGRESRPTTLHDTVVTSVFEGDELGAAYGSWVLTIGSYSEVLSDFGGAGALPGQSIHGTNVPDVIGQRLSSGGIRVTNEDIETLAELDDIVGARVTIFDSSSPFTDRDAVRSAHWGMATTDFPDRVPRYPTTAYS